MLDGYGELIGDALLTIFVVGVKRKMTWARRFLKKGRKGSRRR